MSIDEGLRSYFKRVEAQALARGLKVISAANPDGRGWRFGYAPIGRKRVRPHPELAKRGARRRAEPELF